VPGPWCVRPGEPVKVDRRNERVTRLEEVGDLARYGQPAGGVDARQQHRLRIAHLEHPSVSSFDSSTAAIRYPCDRPLRCVPRGTRGAALFTQVRAPAGSPGTRGVIADGDPGMDRGRVVYRLGASHTHARKARMEITGADSITDTGVRQIGRGRGSEKEEPPGRIRPGETGCAPLRFLFCDE
jgi:hypothetical protein